MEKKLDYSWPLVKARTLVVGADIAAIITAPVVGAREQLDFSIVST